MKPFIPVAQIHADGTVVEHPHPKPDADGWTETPMDVLLQALRQWFAPDHSAFGTKDNAEMMLLAAVAELKFLHGMRPKDIVALVKKGTRLTPEAVQGACKQHVMQVRAERKAKGA